MEEGGGLWWGGVRWIFHFVTPPFPRVALVCVFYMRDAIFITRSAVRLIFKLPGRLGEWVGGGDVSFWPRAI